MTTPTTREICSPWITQADLPDSAPTLDASEWDLILWAVSERLYLLTGRQWSGGGCESTVTATWGSRCWTVARTGQVAGPGLPIQLPGAPVTSILSAVAGGDPFTDYRAELPAGLVYVTAAVPPPSVTFTYRHGIPPPVGGLLAAVDLAVEYGKARAGDQSCRLGPRVTQVTREGVTVDLSTESESELTGIPSVDGWVRSVNPQGLRCNATVWSPDSPQVRQGA